MKNNTNSLIKILTNTLNNTKNLLDNTNIKLTKGAEVSGTYFCKVKRESQLTLWESQWWNYACLVVTYVLALLFLVEVHHKVLLAIGIFHLQRQATPQFVC